MKTETLDLDAELQKLQQQKKLFNAHQDNTEAALKFAFQEHKYTETRPLIHSPTSIEDLATNIAILDEIKDNHLGIKRYQDGNNIVRDATNVTNDKKLLKKDAGEKYAMQVLNQVRGAVLLIETNDEITDKEKHISQLLALANNSLTEIDTLPKKIRSYNSAMLSILKNAGIENAAEELNLAKEIASFKDTHKNIITLTQHDGHTIAEADVIIEPTDEQKKQYQDIADGNGAKLTWYNKLPPYQKALIQNVAGDIATGKKVIPAQMRDLMGLRNAYEKTTAIKKEGENNYKPIVQSIHCGAPSSENEHDKAAITQANIEQLKAHANGRKLNLNILSNFFTGKDKRKENWITEGLEAAKTNRDITTTSLPIHKWRLTSAKTEHEQFDSALKSLGEKLAEKNSNINNKILIEYLKTGKGNYKTALKQIDSMPEYQQTALKAAIHARKNLGKWNIFKTKNVNLEISADILIVESAIDKGGLSSLYANAEEDRQKTVSFCKSGKDRTGLVMLIATKNAVRYELNLSSKKSIEYLETLAAGGHTQEMAGTQGGTVGNHSIKMSKKFGVYTEFGLPIDYWPIDGVINQKSAGYNSKIKQAKGKEEKEEATKLFETAQKEGKSIQTTRKNYKKSQENPLILDEQEEKIPLQTRINLREAVDKVIAEQNAIKQTLKDNQQATVPSVVKTPLPLDREKLKNTQNPLESGRTH